MKKLLVLLFTLCLVGCTKPSGQWVVYSFPGTVTAMEVTYAGGGLVQDFTVTEKEDIRLIRKWFENLKLSPMTFVPEPCEGNQSISVRVDGENAFTYDDRGETEAYVYRDGVYYRVDNPADFPMIP